MRHLLVLLAVGAVCGCGQLQEYRDSVTLGLLPPAEVLAADAYPGFAIGTGVEFQDSRGTWLRLLFESPEGAEHVLTLTYAAREDRRVPRASRTLKRGCPEARAGARLLRRRARAWFSEHELAGIQALPRPPYEQHDPHVVAAWWADRIARSLEEYSDRGAN